MWSLANFSLFLFIFSSISTLCYCQSQQISKTIYVDLHGNGADFQSIQAAIDSVPDKNNQWIKIHIKPEVYNEKVTIGSSKGFIILEGEVAEQTVIQWGDFYDGKDVSETPLGLVNSTWNTATFVSQASNLILSTLTFKNSYTSTTDVQITVAALIGGENTSVYNCRFIGVQDTLSDHLGKHYFKNCYIEGAIDFIFGFGQSIYEGCIISTIATNRGPGYVTAQGRNSLDETSGFVFKYCNLTSETGTKTYLGRAWRDFSRVLFYQTSMDDIVISEGWQSWNARNGGAFTYFAEQGCYGPGSDTSGRVPWEKKLSETEADQLADISYINQGGWLDQQPDGYRY